LAIVDEGVNSKTRILLEYWGFMVKALMKHVICLGGSLELHLSLRRLVVFLDIHFLILVCSIVDHIM